MSFNALYFPNLSLPSSSWTNPVALYFDRIGIIAPSSYEAGLSDQKTARFIEAGLALPLFGGAFGHVSDDMEIVEEIVNWWRRSRRERRPYELYKIHEGKLAHTSLLRGLTERGLLRPDPFERRWLVGPEPVCMRIMTMLASRILSAGEANAMVTNQRAAFGFAIGQSQVNERAEERRTKAVARLLPVGPWVSPEEFFRFKEANREELRQFRAFIEQLIRRNHEDEDFDSRLTAAERLREHLVGELDNIDARSEDGSLTVSLSKLGAIAAEGSYISGAIDMLTGARTRRADMRRRSEIRRDGLAYAALAQSAMRPKSSNHLLS